LGGFKIKAVTTYPFLLFVSNTQSIKVDTKPRPSPLNELR